MSNLVPIALTDHVVLLSLSLLSFTRPLARVRMYLHAFNFMIITSEKQGKCKTAPA